MLGPVYPLFPLVESGFETRGSELMKSVAEIELRLAEELSDRFFREQTRDALHFFSEERFESRGEFVGDLFLFGSQFRVIHDRPRGKKRAKFGQTHAPASRVADFPPTFELLTLASG